MSTLTATAQEQSSAHPRAVRSRVRLTRRGRFVVILFVATLLLAAFSIGRVSLQASTDRSAGSGTYESVVVGSGETLWDIAREAAPGVDPRVTVARIVELNALPGSAVRQGQELLLPS